jgi:hypothetical protein
LLNEPRSLEERIEIRSILHHLELDRNRFANKFPLISRKTQARLLVNQLNYIKIVFENNLVYL